MSKRRKRPGSDLLHLSLADVAPEATASIQRLSTDGRRINRVETLLQPPKRVRTQDPPSSTPIEDTTDYLINDLSGFINPEIVQHTAKRRYQSSVGFFD